MLWANVEGTRTRATPGASGICPGCSSPVIAKCGEINIWHWSHLAERDCDPWFEPECRWHLEWKEMAPSGQCEVTIGGHRADIVTIDGRVIELQHSSLSPSEVREREQHYGKMIWIIDASEFEGNLSIRFRGEFWSFRWKWPRKWMMSIQKPLFWDFGDGELFQVKKIHEHTPCGGWGQYVEFSTFCNHFRPHTSRAMEVSG